MSKTLFLALGWVAAAAALYGSLLVLELCWNLYDWQPILDWKTLGLFLWMIALLAAIGLLARATRGRGIRAVSAVPCVALLALAMYVSPAERTTGGLFARRAPSPLWYRGGRLLVLALPSAFWVLSLRRLSGSTPALGTR